MIHQSRSTSLFLSTTLFALSSVLALGCNDAMEGGVGSGGAESSQSSGGENSHGGAQSGAGSGGASGASADAFGGDAPTAQSGGSPNGGASNPNSSSAGGATLAEAGEASTSGGASGGTTSTGATASGGGNETAFGGDDGETSAGAGSDPNAEDPICNDVNGDAIPYDFSNGIATEYAFELSMNCEVGGYIMPLVAADPDQLSEVNKFIGTLTDWYRSTILRCDGAQTSLGPNDYGLLPISESADLSEADSDASASLFMMVLDRHDNQPDGVDAKHKQKIKDRLKSSGKHAVKNDKAELTKPLPPSDCVPLQ